MINLESKTVLILGFTRRTSYAAALALLKRKARLIISDTVDNEEKRALLEQLSYRGEVINALGDQSVRILDDFPIDIVLPSPGVPLNIPIIQAALSRGIEVMGDIELFYRLHPSLTYVAITGTDGKTTTTTLTHAIIAAERDARVGGNIGTAIFELEEDLSEDTIIVLELSSFQLEEIRDFHPRVAAFLNIAEDHMDRYASLQEYLLAKKRIFANMDVSDTAIVNLDSPAYRDIVSHVRASLQTFSRFDYRADAYFDGRTIFHYQRPLLETDDIKLIGVHNMENIMAAVLMARSLGISEKAISNTLAVFHGLPHRLEFVANVQGVEYYNDSKSTTVNSLQKALESFQQPVHLIVGGRDKGLDFTVLSELVQEKLKNLILIGEASEKIERELSFQPSHRAKSMKDAVETARRLADPGDVVLLSPGCASFDMYRNYEERGEDFKRNVNLIMQI